MRSLALGIGGSPLLWNDLIRLLSLARGRLFSAIDQIGNAMFDCCARSLRRSPPNERLLSKSDRFSFRLAYYITAPFGVEPHQAVDQTDGHDIELVHPRREPKNSRVAAPAQFVLIRDEDENFRALRQIRQKFGAVLGDP